jgi:nucleoside-diphosphate-sugar epimerase
MLKKMIVETVFITGGTGYIGTRLIKALLQEENFNTRALVRKGAENKLPPGCEIIFGNALDASTYRDSIAPATIFVHLVGVAHPSPAKKEQFQSIDLVSVQEAVKAAAARGIRHFIYLSVAMYPTRIMKDFQQLRAEGEAMLLQQNFVSSFVRPWYVLGPGHWWPILLKPLYAIAKLLPSKREAARQLSTVTIKQVVDTLLFAIKNPPSKNFVYDTEKIKNINH